MEKTNMPQPFLNNREVVQSVWSSGFIGVHLPSLHDSVPTYYEW